MNKPDTHEPWCPDWGYEECTCDLEERRARYEREHRDPNAAELPRAIIRTAKS